MGSIGLGAVRICWFLLCCISSKILLSQSSELGLCNGKLCVRSLDSDTAEFIVIPGPPTASPPPPPPSAQRHRNPGQCTSDGEAIAIGESLYRVGEKLRGTQAVDLCFVVSAAMTMAGAQRWLQIAVPYIEEELRGKRIGISRGFENRYCLVQFGARGKFLRATFLKVSNNIFFADEQFHLARRQLKRNGDIADGYEALEFTVKNAPFRADSNIAKLVVMVSNMGRSVLASRTNLTREVMQTLFNERQISLDVVVEVEMKFTQNTTELVLGLHDLDQASVIRPNGKFEKLTGSIFFRSSAGATINDYLALALNLGGSTWPIDLLKMENSNYLMSFSRALIEAHDLRKAVTVSVCERCECVEEEGGTELQCREPPDERFCRCMANATSEQCTKVSPTPTAVLPTTTEVTSLLPAVNPTPAILFIDGQLVHQQDGDVQFAFQGNSADIAFECILLEDSADNIRPPISPCTTSYILNDLQEGDYNLLVIGRLGRQQATRLIAFDVILGSSDPFDVTVSNQTKANGSIIIFFFANREQVDFSCSVGGSDFFECSSPHRIGPGEPGEDTVFFVVLATDRKGGVASRTLTIERPTHATPAGPIMMEVSTELPDAFGVIIIRFTLSRQDATCSCRVDVGAPEVCQNQFIADPRNIDPGAHVLKITCMDTDAYAVTSTVDFFLDIPPPTPSGPLTCDLALVGPDDEGILTADFSCNRGVTATCQVDRLLEETCSSTSVYMFDTASLGPRNHQFILVAEDGFGDSVMKIYPFMILQARRRCCPTILRQNSTTTASAVSMQVDLHIEVSSGNCSQDEGFSYLVNWGDDASEAAMRHHSGPVDNSHIYSNAGDYDIQVAFCNNPVNDTARCCDNLQMSVHLPAPNHSL